MNKSNEKLIHIIDDDIEICQALRWLFESVEFRVETYSSALKFLTNYYSTIHGCILLDIRMPSMSGLELLEKLKALNNKLPIIMISAYGDVAMAVRAMQMGAVDFILKPISDQNLIEIINRSFNNKIEKNFREHAKIDLLTPREKEVMNLIIEGKYNKEIAYDLNISISTVEAHRANIMEKYQAKNLVHLIKIYYNIP